MAVLYAGRLDRKLATMGAEVTGVSSIAMYGSPLMGLMTELTGSDPTAPFASLPSPARATTPAPRAGAARPATCGSSVRSGGCVAHVSVRKVNGTPPVRPGPRRAHVPAAPRAPGAWRAWGSGVGGGGREGIG